MSIRHQFPKNTPPILFNKKPFLADIPYNWINRHEMTAPKEILDLVERFDRNRDAYKDVIHYELYGLTDEEIRIVEESRS